MSRSEWGMQGNKLAAQRDAAWSRGDKQGYFGKIQEIRKIHAKIPHE